MQPIRPSLFVGLMVWIAGISLTLAQSSSPAELLPTHFTPMVLPQDSSKSAGFTCELTLSEDPSPGYDTVRLRFSLPVASPAQRQLIARLTPDSEDMVPSRGVIITELPIVIEQGTKELEVMRFIPKWTFGNHYSFELFEDGQPLVDYAIEFGASVRNRNQILDETRNSELSHQWLIVSSNKTESEQAFQKLNPWFDSDFGVMNPQFSRGMGFFHPEVKLVTCETDSLPLDWRGLQAMDVIAVDLKALVQLRDSQLPKYKAIRDWVLFGGTVVIRQCESEAALAAAFGHTLPSAAALRDLHWIDDAVKEHQRLTDELKSASVGILNGNLNEQDRLELQSELSESLLRAEADAKVTPKIWSDSIFRLSLGAGQVIGLSQHDPETAVHWSIVSRIQSGWRSLALRRGVDPLLGDMRFRRWLIPGVAQPPVYTFMGLLTVFVILVGPVAYRQTTRSGRGYLMFIIAPILALVTTVSMFVYGIVADGFGTVARVRQITYVDGQSQDAVTRTRGSYFAGIRPADGLRFDASAEVLWYPDGTEVDANALLKAELPPLGRVTIDSANQRFSSGVLPSREQRQFVVQQSLPQFGKVTATRKDDHSPLVVENSLAINLLDITIRDREGAFWIAEELPAGGRLQIAASTTKAYTSKRLGDLYNRQRLLEESGSSRRNPFNRFAVDTLSFLNQLMFPGDSDAIDGAMEYWLKQNLQLGGSLPPGSFIATSAIDLRFIAVEGAELVQSIHFVTGTLP